MPHSNPFRYRFREPHKSTSCLFKLWFGQKYFIWKCKALYQSIDQFSVEIDRRLRLGLKEGDIYTGIVRYITRTRITQMEVEVLQDIDNPAELLKEEYLALKKAQKDENCINTVWDPLTPKWIPETAVQEFTEWKLAQQKKKRVNKAAGAKKRAKTIADKKKAAKKKSAPKKKANAAKSN